MKYKVIIQIFLFFLISGCINLKDEYPDIKYYSLKQEKLSSREFFKIKGKLLVRDFTINGGSFGTQIMANWDGIRVQRYFYHRWSDDFDVLSRDFVIHRLNLSSIFENGVSTSVSSILPDYILDCQILDLFISNKSNDDDINYVNLEININLVKRGESVKENKVLINKNYSQRVVRLDNKIENVADAVSKALAAIADEMIIDISNSVTNYIK